MAKLILSLDDRVIKDFDISKERMTIGRKPHNDIQIDNLAVSGEHAMIMTILNDSFLEDLGSTNGTMVNGAPVKKHFLQPDDVVEIGKYKLRYVNEKAGKVSQQDFEKTMILRAPAGGTPAAPPPRAATDTQTDIGGRKLTGTQSGLQTSTVSGAKVTDTSGQTATIAQKPDAAVKQPVNPQQTPQAQPVADTGGAIQILSGPNAGRELALSKPLTTLGKPGIQVAVIAKRPQGYFITHVEGANFPVVNGKPLDAQAQKLQDHDVIQLAGVKMEFFMKG